jgi:hypothetical protein
VLPLGQDSAEMGPGVIKIKRDTSRRIRMAPIAHRYPALILGSFAIIAMIQNFAHPPCDGFSLYLIFIEII